MHCLFLTPALDGPATGGTLYNRALLAALAELPERARNGLTFQQLSLTGLSQTPARPDQLWVDSLYLAELPALRARFAHPPGVGLLLHYLPSLVRAPELSTAAELSDRELRALAAADMVVTPSEYLRQLVLRIRPERRCASVPPGVALTQPGGAAARTRTALMICNVTQNKGVLALLQALAQVVSPAASFRVAIAGDLQLEAAYARSCLALCEQHGWLREHVTFLGSVAQRELFARLGRASVLVSASRMESYGMALAEARALGTPILALAGGNVSQHVAAESGGELVHSPRQLAEALCALMSDPGELRARAVRARASASVRPWRAVAEDFVAAAIGWLGLRASDRAAPDIG